MRLKMDDILGLCGKLMAQGISMDEIKEMPVYIGDDDELNGIHTAWYAQLVDANSPEDEGYVELINEDRHNIQIKGKAVLIS